MLDLNNRQSKPNAKHAFGANKNNLFVSNLHLMGGDFPLIVDNFPVWYSFPNLKSLITITIIIHKLYLSSFWPPSRRLSCWKLQTQWHWRWFRFLLPCWPLLRCLTGLETKLAHSPGSFPSLIASFSIFTQSIKRNIRRRRESVWPCCQSITPSVCGAQLASV